MKNTYIKKNEKWKFWIDRGGTFTDIISIGPDKKIEILKLLSENSSQYSDAAIEGIKKIMKKRFGKKDFLKNIEYLKIGTTLSTNALLEKKGEPTVLLTTKGYGDILRIGYQKRPDIFALKINIPEMLYKESLEIEERVLSNGKVDIPLNIELAKNDLKSLFNLGYKSVAVVFMHAYHYPQHEKTVGDLCKEIGFTQISLSHQTSPLIKIVSRGDTTVVDAYTSPLLKKYSEKLSKELPYTKILFMQSNGGLAKSNHFKGKDSILSGPAGGVVGAIKTSRNAGLKKIIGFDMGGTSTDVCHYNGELEKTNETEIAGVRISTPMIALNTVAAGGGSILNFDGSRFRVGPNSAGAKPGPACYKNSGPLTITDANLMVGKLQTDFFPTVFGKDSNENIDKNIVQQEFKNLSNTIKSEYEKTISPEEIASGFLDIAINNMSNAIKKISIERGHNLREYALCCFGGAAGQHACLVADKLEIKKIFFHPFGGVLSAFGIGLSDLAVVKEKTIEKNLNKTTLIKINKQIKILEQDCNKEIIQQSNSSIKIIFSKFIFIKYEGSDTSIPIKLGTLSSTIKNFTYEHKKRFGFIYSDKKFVIESLRIEAIGKEYDETNNIPIPQNNRDIKIKPDRYVNIYTEKKWTKTKILERENIEKHISINGPCIIKENYSTIIIEPGWKATLTKKNEIIAEKILTKKPKKEYSEVVDPVLLEIFNNMFMSIAEQMGSTLQKTASSVNIKERLDFSCAIFDAKGNLIANAPHIPVHLGSMSESIQAIIKKRKKNINIGDIYMLNSPYDGGTHLPDITIIKPIFNDKTKEILFFTGSRGHHSDIGGITPGSMPPNSKHIEEEGVLIDNFLIVEKGTFREQETKKLLLSGKYPSRNVEINISDLKAQIASCEKGSIELQKLIQEYGLNVVFAYMKHIRKNAEESIRKVVKKIEQSSTSYHLDDGTKINIKITPDKKLRNVEIDFSGTSKPHPRNFNTPTSVAKAAVLYVFRTLVADEIPINSGCLNPIKIIIPEICLLKPKYPSAVVAGNVETSQNITEAIFASLKILSGSQGTMNNFTFGNSKYQYYETIAGGTGAGKGFNGRAAVQAHMTNTKITDPEILELRYPVVLESHKIIYGSGGKGKWNGGDGTIRRIKFLEKMTASILSSHRIIPPHGINGGENGKCGKNWIERANGTIEKEKTGCWEVNVFNGDTFIIQTPTGGGYGKKKIQ